MKVTKNFPYQPPRRFRPRSSVPWAHEERYLKLLKNIEIEALVEKADDVMWQCRECGHLALGKKAPDVCPVCAHPQSYQQVRVEND